MDTAFLQALQLVWPNKSLKTNNCSLCVIKGDILYADVGIIYFEKNWYIAACATTYFYTDPPSLNKITKKPSATFYAIKI